MGFMVGKSSAEPSLKLHLLRLEMQPLYQQDACSGVHTDLKMTRYVLWCNTQERLKAWRDPEEMFS
jgi:hypothetical protein